MLILIILTFQVVLITSALVASALSAPAGPPAPYHPAPYHPAPHHPAPHKIPPRPFAYAYGVSDEYSGTNFDKKETQVSMILKKHQF